MQEVVKLDVIPDYESAEISAHKSQNEAVAVLTPETPMASAIEITLKGTTIKFTNDIRPDLMKAILQFLGCALC